MRQRWINMMVVPVKNEGFSPVSTGAVPVQNQFFVFSSLKQKPGWFTDASSRSCSPSFTSSLKTQTFCYVTHCSQTCSSGSQREPSQNWLCATESDTRVFGDDTHIHPCSTHKLMRVILCIAFSFSRIKKDYMECPFHLNPRVRIHKEIPQDRAEWRLQWGLRAVLDYSGTLVSAVLLEEGGRMMEEGWRMSWAGRTDQEYQE